MAEHDKLSSIFLWNGNQKHDWGLRGRRYISHSNVSMRLFGSTGEPDVLGEGIRYGGLIISL